jgi:hypothetical protein
MMIRSISTLAALMLSGSVFTMCDGGKVPEGCCDPGDTLNIILPDANTQRCEDMGGRMTGFICEDVDF